MWQPVLVSINSDEPLQVQSYTAFLVRLQLRNADEHVGADRTARDGILMLAIMVVGIGLGNIVVRAIIGLAPAVEFREKAHARQIYFHTAHRVTRKLHGFDIDSIFLQPLLFSKIDEGNVATFIFGIEALHFWQSHALNDSVKVRVRLRRIT